ncbi:MAG TPA: hypothetical protein VI776_07375 [Anaerolineales bacterium]|jgi:hypothetical protein|nr:hypothetical protein [Anaerolineales bacterium]
MFYRGSFFIRFLLVLVLLGVLAAGGYLIFQAGQAQGYALGQAAAGDPPGAQALPYPGYFPYMMPYRGFFFPPFFGLLCVGGLLFVFFLAAGGLFRPHHWRHTPHDPYHEHWHGWHEGKHPGESPQAKEGQSPEAGTRPENP